jgi:hypothetical protein
MALYIIVIEPFFVLICFTLFICCFFFVTLQEKGVDIITVH